MGKIKFKNFYQIEKSWLEAMFSVNFEGEEIILNQLNNAKVSRDYNIGYISLKIEVNKDIKQFPFQVRVPIQMRVIGKNGMPIVFLLHVINGFVNELEIFNADSSPINSNIHIGKKEIIIDESLLWKFSHI